MRLIAFLIGVFCLSAFANFYEYGLNSYPVEKTACPEVAKTISQKLAEATGVSIYQTYCKPEKYGNDLQIVITYESDRALPLVSTYSPSYFPSLAAYRSLEDCEAALSSEKDHFEKATGIAPFLAYCYFEPLHTTVGPTFSLRIDGFGAPKQYFFNTGSMMEPGLIIGDKPVLENRIKDGLIANKVDVVTVILLDSISYHDLIVRYYGKYKLYFDVEPFSRYSKDDICLAQLKEAEAVLTQAPNPPLALFCSSGAAPWYATLQIVTLKPLGWNQFIAPDRFSSVEDCMSNRDRVIQYFKEKQKKSIAGGFCGYGDDMYHLILFESKK